MRRASVPCLVLAVFLAFVSPGWGQWKPHSVRQLNGHSEVIASPADFQIVSESWNRVAAAPYLVFMPEKDRLLMLIGVDYPHRAAVLTSDDRGATWGQPTYLHVDAAGKPDAEMGVGLTYLGSGRAVLMGGEALNLWSSNDFGGSWERVVSPPTAKGDIFGIWDPLLADTDPQTGRISRLGATGYQPSVMKERGEPRYQGLIKWSTDEGRHWTASVAVPEWMGFNEIELARAKNGDLIAACRSDLPKRFMKLTLDHYSGLVVSISKDNGKTWSKMNMLYDWGRHHPSMALLPNGDIVMSYVVRRGYPDTDDGYPQFGIEAVVSRDHGQTWDLDHRYILATWKGSIKGSAYWYNSCQATSTVIMPDGSLLTAFGTGCRAQIDHAYFAHPKPRDIGLVHWHLGDQPLANDRTIALAPFDSDVRNKFDPHPELKRTVASSGCGENVAVRAAGAELRGTASDEDLNDLLYDGYTHPVVTLETIPAQIEITWPGAQRISEIRLYPGAPAQSGHPNTECVPLDYRLQFEKAGKWVDLFPPVTNAPRFKDWSQTAQNDGQVLPYVDFQYVHKFAPITTKAIRLVVTRSSDSGRREGSLTDLLVPADKRETVLRRIDVIAAK